MENMRKKQWYIGASLFVLTLFFTFGWIAIYQVIAVPQASSSWLLPIVWFSFGITSLCLLALSWGDKKMFALGASIAFLPALFFVHDVRFILFSCAFVGLSVIGLSRMRYAMSLSVKIQVRRSMQYGISLIIFAFSLAIASFYYMQIRTASGDELLQKLSLDQASHVMLTRSLGLLNPEFKKVDQEKISVDAFLLTFQEDRPVEDNTVATLPSDNELLQMAGIKPTDPRAPQALSRMKKELEENSGSFDTSSLILEQSRKQLSEIAGRPLSGQEPIADVLSQIIDHRVRTYFQPNMVNGNNTSVLPFVLSVILFLTLWSLGAVLGIAWRLMTAGAFHLLRRLDIIEVKKVTVEQEVVS